MSLIKLPSPVCWAPSSCFLTSQGNRAASLPYGSNSFDNGPRSPERGVGIIDLQLVEDGIETGKVMMEELIKAQDAAVAATEKTSNGANGGNGNGAATQEAANGEGKTAEAKCPFSSAVENGDGNVGLYLNEVGLMTELEARKKKN